MEKKLIETIQRYKELMNINESDILGSLGKLKDNVVNTVDDYLEKVGVDIIDDMPKPESDDLTKGKSSDLSAKTTKEKNTKVGNIKHNYIGDAAENIQLIIRELEKNGVTNPVSQVAILSVIGKESSFIPRNELSYKNTSNEKIRSIFGERVSKLSDEELNNIKKDDEKFFDLVYGGKSGMNLGNTNVGDGYLYLGRGFNGITGKSNYKKYGDMINVNILDEPQTLNNPTIAAKIAAKYFTNNPKRNLNDFMSINDAINYFSDVNAGGKSEWARKNSKKMYSGHFELL
jgi:predicted chitinase